ncbi:MAG: glucose-6-phosphate dehydrogenase assembly protein OpcA [Acidobacteriota bacterium]|nr:glucose-6-phosphate dehydrogenase assembly protein OpcA [Acidobacteriota bacterium]
MEGQLNPAVPAINPEKILRELRDLWAQLAKDQDGAGGVLRACSMTLIVVAEPDDVADAETARKTIGVLMHVHPSRAIVLTPHEGGEFSGRVFAECWMPFGGQQQICSEGIEISADSEQTDEVARLLVPLIAPDLPVVLWCRGPRAFLDRSLDPLFPLANKIIFNTRAVRHSSSAIEFLRRMRKEGGKAGRQVADLAWPRLTGWREAVAHLMDACPGGWLAAAGGEVRIEYGGGRPGTRTLYFARWIESALPGANVALIPIEGGPGVHSVVFAGCGAETSVRLGEGSSLEVRTAERSYSAVLPSDSEECLMREELSILGKDPVFDRVLG